MDLTETQMESMMEPIKVKWRCTRGINGLYDTIASRQGYYVHAATEEEALSYMRCMFPLETLFTVHEWGKWLSIIG